jgi:glycosyltransferase involved in cell wall biosynthesis
VTGARAAIVNWNVKDLLRNCLRSIYASRQGIAIQVIVVDNESSDGSTEMIARTFPDVTLINSGGNLGFAKANNVGLESSSGPLILFLNPDTRRAPLSETIRLGAQLMLQKAVELEVTQFLGRDHYQRHGEGLLQGYRNGYEDIEEIVDQLIRQSQAAGPKDHGKVMKAVMAKISGQAEGKVVSVVYKHPYYPVAFLVAKGSTKLLDEMNAALSQFIYDGIVDQLKTNWHIPIT